MTHGTNYAYTDRGCRCDECRAAHAAYRAAVRKRAYLRHGAPAMVDATGTIRRIQALQAIGWALPDLDAHLGRRRTYCSVITTRRFITQATADSIATLYEQLCMTPGPSLRAKRAALRKGYTPPLGWDDIDTDPAPAADAAAQDRSLAVADDLEWIVGTEAPDSVAHRLGYSNPSNLARVLHRINRVDLVRKLERAS